MPSAVSPNPRFSVVIPTRDTRRLTLRCLASVFEHPPPESEVILVDDGSRDDTARAVRERFPSVRLLQQETPRGFTSSANRGLSTARGEILFLLNSDTEVDPGAWEALERTFERDGDLGIAGAALRYPDGTPQWSGGSAPTLLWLFGMASGLPSALGGLPGARTVRPVRASDGGPVDWVTGAAMALRREVWDDLGPLDERFRFYCQDLDLCLRARKAGWKVEVIPGLRVVHHHGATVARQPGAIGHDEPELLWSDLVRWAWKERGSAWARRAALALRAGGRLRLVGRRLRGLFHPSATRRAWRDESLAYRRALAGVRDLLADLNQGSSENTTATSNPETDDLKTDA